MNRMAVPWKSAHTKCPMLLHQRIDQYLECSLSLDICLAHGLKADAPSLGTGKKKDYEVTEKITCDQQ